MKYWYIQKPGFVLELKNPALAAVAGDSRRGSMAGSRLGSRRGSAAAGRSRAGSISLGGVERRGSYYGEDVSKRSTVAVVVDDPDGKKNMEKQLEAVFNGNGKSINFMILRSRNWLLPFSPKFACSPKRIVFSFSKACIVWDKI